MSKNEKSALLPLSRGVRKTCEVCGGHGFVDAYVKRAGSRVPRYRPNPCPDALCGTRGWYIVAEDKGD
jgi:hypothetical protein